MGFLDIFRRGAAAPAPASRGTVRSAVPVPARRNYVAPRREDGTRPRSSYERAPSAIRDIRAAARSLARNNPYCASAVSVVANYLIGKGIRFSMMGDSAYDVAWFEFCNDRFSDANGRMNVYQMQHVAAKTMIEAGECFVIIRDVVRQGRATITLQLIDPDMLDDAARPQGVGNAIYGGVEVDRYGDVVRYHFREPSDGGRVGDKSYSVAARDVVHIFESLYPGQIRGIPRGIQVLQRAGALDDYLSAALTRAHAEAALSVFVIAAEDQAAGGGIIGAEADDEISAPLHYDGLEREYIEPGSVSLLPHGADVKTIVPSSSVGVRDFSEISLQAIAAGYRCTYEQVSGDASRSNYSSHKASMGRFVRDVETVRELYIVPRLLDIERRFRSAYELAAGREVSGDLEIVAVSPGRDIIEPTKEIAAEMTELQAGLKTWRQAVLQRGLDPDIQLAELQKERAQLAAAGIDIHFATVQLLAAAAAAAAEEEEDQPGDGKGTEDSARPAAASKRRAMSSS